MLLIWLVMNLYKSMPANEHFPPFLRFWTPYLGVAAGLIVARSTVLQGSNLVRFFFYLNRAAQFSLATVALFLLVGLLISGLAFTRTAHRIAVGALVRNYSSLVLSYILAQFVDPVSRTSIRISNTADTLVSLFVALYWAQALATEAADEQRSREDWIENGQSLIQELRP